MSFINQSQEASTKNGSIASVDIKAFDQEKNSNLPSFLSPEKTVLQRSNQIPCDLLILDELIPDSTFFSENVELGFEDKLTGIKKGSGFWSRFDKYEAPSVLSGVTASSLHFGEYLGGSASLYLDSYLGKSSQADNFHIKTFQGKAAAYSMLGFQKALSGMKFGSILGNRFQFYGDLTDFDSEQGLCGADSENQNLGLLFRKKQLVGLFTDDFCKLGSEHEKSEKAESSTRARQIGLLTLAMELNMAPSRLEFVKKADSGLLNYDFDNLEG